MKASTILSLAPAALREGADENVAAPVRIAVRWMNWRRLVCFMTGGKCVVVNQRVGVRLESGQETAGSSHVVPIVIAESCNEVLLFLPHADCHQHEYKASRGEDKPIGCGER